MFQILVSMLDSYCLIQRLNIKSYHFTANEKKGSLCSQNSTKYLLMALWRWAVTVNGDLWIRWGSASSNDASSAYQKVPIKLQCTPTNVPRGLISRAHPSRCTHALPEVPITPARWTWLFWLLNKQDAEKDREARCSATSLRSSQQLSARPLHEGLHLPGEDRCPPPRSSGQDAHFQSGKKESTCFAGTIQGHRGVKLIVL